MMWLPDTPLTHSALAQIVVAAMASTTTAELKTVFIVWIPSGTPPRRHFSALGGGLQVRRF